MTNLILLETKYVVRRTFNGKEAGYFGKGNYFSRFDDRNFADKYGFKSFKNAENCISKYVNNENFEYDVIPVYFYNIGYSYNEEFN